MSKSLPQLTLVPSRTPQLQCVNEKIAALVAVKPWGGIYAAFSLAAHLAMEAVSTASELDKMPGIERDQMRLVVDFWYSFADQARTAALACLGGSQTLAEATVAFLFLQTSCARKPAGAESTPRDGKGKVVGQ